MTTPAMLPSDFRAGLESWLNNNPKAEAEDMINASIVLAGFLGPFTLDGYLYPEVVEQLLIDLDEMHNLREGALGRGVIAAENKREARELKNAWAGMSMQVDWMLHELLLGADQANRLVSRDRGDYLDTFERD